MDNGRILQGARTFVPLVILLALTVLFMPRSGKFNYDYRKGAPWMYETLVSEFDFPVLKTEAQLQSEKDAAVSSVIPYYKYSENITSERHDALEAIDLGKYGYMKPAVAAALDSIYTKGVVAERPDFKDGISENEQVIYVQRNRRAALVPPSEIYTAAQARSRFLSDIRNIAQGCNVDSICSASGILDLIVPNLIFDQQTTDLVHEESVNYVSPTSGYVSAGQVIVSKGETVTAEIEQLLDSYKAEYENSVGYNGPRILLWIGNVLLSIVLVALLFFTVYYSNPRIFRNFNKYIYILVLFLISALVTFAVAKADARLLYVVPYTLFALYLTAFFRNNVVYPLYIVSLIPLLVFSHNGIELFVMYLVAGVTAIYTFSFFSKGWQQFIMAFFVFLSLLVTYLAFKLVDGEIRGFRDYQTILFLFIGSMMSVAGYPLIYLFEKIFMLVSNSRLVELCDTNNKLLRELATKAPGTFQHCLQVMNLADAASRSIGANVALVRAGALYHDIGKMNNPQCFIENETPGVKYHEGLSPEESARDITRHVPDGMVLAEKYGLPDVVKDFIVTHHGTTCAAYFYNKYLNEGGDPSKTDVFFYKGRKPSTKEQIILMLCDTLEAASRTLKDYSHQSISDLVERIVKSKMDDGQFEEADISLKELNVVKDVLKDYLQQMYHARIVYPKRKTEADKA
ncbi:MAG: HDIG domain-containing protein [Bacteroidetes bacterium]|uniref:HDIG domain-containing protein n=1 Tax=Candidatus Cryptobacteroides intestinigallinarum TaxID=2840767 RepID=A0A9D9HLM5_9BACT|nr:HDIG domain-containing protein [Candidatus Cryptobacteroides intestinigallinarum]